VEKLGIGQLSHRLARLRRTGRILNSEKTIAEGIVIRP